MTKPKKVRRHPPVWLPSRPIAIGDGTTLPSGRRSEPPNDCWTEEGNQPMSTADRLTRAELREDLDTLRKEFREEFKHYATKADLAELKTNIAGMVWRVGVALSPFVAVLVHVIGPDLIRALKG